MENIINISNKANLFNIKYEQHWVTSKTYMNPFGVHLLCLWPDVVPTSFLNNTSYRLYRKMTINGYFTI